MPNRKIVNGEPYRYAYQGPEIDPETGKEAFQLRLYDSRIGRWLTIDPKHEFSSPYLAMANNPANVVDPDGGCTDCPNNAKDGDPYYHQDLGQLTYDASSGFWEDALGGTVLNDVNVGDALLSGYEVIEPHISGLNDVLVGSGLSQSRAWYNNGNHQKVNKFYEKTFKFLKKLNIDIPRPGVQRDYLKRTLKKAKKSPSSKFLRKAGYLGSALTITNIEIDVAQDGKIKFSNIIDGTVLVAGGVLLVVYAPGAAILGTVVLAYGALDYTFKTNDWIDSKVQQIKIYDK